MVYDRPLQNNDNPYSLWPSKTKSHDNSRFNVSPVTGDDVAPLPNVRAPRTRRRSCFPGGQVGRPRPSTGHSALQKADSNEGKTETTAF